jgi:hypothetical protein
MKAAFRIALPVLCLAAACNRRPLASGADAGADGITFTGPDAAGVDAPADAVGPADAGGGRDVLAPDLAQALACASDSDCVATFFPKAVASPADCYCQNCGLWPLNKMSDAAFAAQWKQHCAPAWLANDVCPIHPCPAPPKIKCASGRCTAGSYVVPSLCPVDPNSGCPNAIACGGTCCAPGEWCDDAIGCRCSYDLACPIGQICGNGPPPGTVPGLCGRSCCFDCVP